MGAAPKIEIFQNGQLLQEIPLKGEMWVGRDEACPVHLDDRAISRKHALFKTTDQGVEFENRSKFGWIKINGQELTQATLKEGDRVEVGPYEIRVKGLLELAQTVQVTPTQVEVAPAIEVTEAEPEENPIEMGLPENTFDLGVAQEPPRIDSKSAEEDDLSQVENDGATRPIRSPELVKAVLFFGPNNANVEHFEIGDQEISLGRSQQCHVVLADKRSSRKHALIRKEGQQYILKDLGSANGTQVNDSRVEGEVNLHSGDHIQIGDTSFTFQMVQADYEQKKEQFLNVPVEEPVSIPSPIMANSYEAQSQFPPMMDGGAFGNVNGHAEPTPVFEAPPEPKKASFIGKILDRYRMMSTKQQIIWGLVAFGGIYMLMEEDPEPVKTAQVQKKPVKKIEEKKAGGLPSFDTLNPEQKRYIEVQYQLGFDLYKNREYDKSIFEIDKIFRIVQDYKQAREIYSYAIEGKRQLEAREDERKRKEKENQDKLRLQALVDQAGVLMEKKKYKEAEGIFPEIELLEPENVVVSGWRKTIAAQSEELERLKKEKERVDALRKKAQADFAQAKKAQANKEYYSAIDQFEEIQEQEGLDAKFSKLLETEIDASYKAIADARDPFLAKGKELEAEGKFTEAYHAYEDALKADPEDTNAPAGMKRIRGTLQGKAKSIYTEGVFAESFNDFETAEKRYCEVMKVVPKDDDYYVKSLSRWKKITVFKKNAALECPQ